jgi:hypothetical protein
VLQAEVIAFGAGVFGLHVPDPGLLVLAVASWAFARDAAVLAGVAAIAGTVAVWRMSRGVPRSRLL